MLTLPGSWVPRKCLNVNLRRASALLLFFPILVCLVWISRSRSALIDIPSFTTNFLNAGSDQANSLQYAKHTPSNPTPLHILIPATQRDSNLCKLLLSAALLDYPPATVLAWDQKVDPSRIEGHLGGGTHLLKISKVLQWLENVPANHEDDLVIMMDGYDIWFQLPKDLLIERYHRINSEANARLRRRMGRAFHEQGIRQTIIFASGKRCYPNEIHTVACWPIPPSPLPEDMWGGNTDSTIASMPNGWATTRQRFLNSGLIMGPVKDMRRLFQRAAEKVQQLGDDPEPDDNGSRWSEFIYHSSDQSVFNMIFGEQEYQREVMRINALSWIYNPILKLQQLFGKDLSDTTLTLEGNRIGNILNPPWSHAQVPHLSGKPLEYSIGLDYWSLLSWQTANSARDAAWLTHSKLIEPQIGRRERFDCIPRAQERLPPDILNIARPPILHIDESSNTIRDHELSSPDHRFGQTSWEQVPLFTNICAGTIPAMIHLNGDKSQREREWKDLWFVSSARALYEAARSPEGLTFSPAIPEQGQPAQPIIQTLTPGSVFSDAGRVLDFSQDLCPDWNFD